MSLPIAIHAWLKNQDKILKVTSYPWFPCFPDRFGRGHDSQKLRNLRILMVSFSSEPVGNYAPRIVFQFRKSLKIRFSPDIFRAASDGPRLIAGGGLSTVLGRLFLARLRCQGGPCPLGPGFGKPRAGGFPPDVRAAFAGFAREKVTGASWHQYKL